MATNGIGPLVRQSVHERNEARRAARTGESVPTTEPVTVDTATFTPEALARFETWKTRHGMTAPAPEPITTPIVTPDPVDTLFLPLPGTTNGEPA